MATNSEKIEFLKGFGKRVQELREGKQLSLRQLAQNCEIDYSDIGKIEKRSKKYSNVYNTRAI